jgi:hypothetical protein
VAVKVWKPLIFIIPAGLALGAIGGEYARPVMTQRGDDGSPQSYFETRAQRYGSATSDPQYQDATYYSGGYSYPPYLDYVPRDDDKAAVGWQSPDFANLPAYTPTPMPTIAQLEAEVAARDAALGQRATATAETSADDQATADVAAEGAGDAVTTADQTQPADADTSATEGHPKIVIVSQAAPPDTPSVEPKTADGTQAIW